MRKKQQKTRKYQKIANSAKNSIKVRKIAQTGEKWPQTPKSGLRRPPGAPDLARSGVPGEASWRPLFGHLGHFSAIWAEMAEMAGIGPRAGISCAGGFCVSALSLTRVDEPPGDIWPPSFLIF